jgi:hypothetical protein
MYVGKEYKKGPVLAIGYKNAPFFMTSKVNYDDLRFGSPQHPIDKNSLNIFLELKNGDIISPSAVNLEWLKGRKAIWIEERQGDEYGQDKLIEYNIAGCSFLLKDQDLVMFRNYGGIMALWDSSKTRRYKLPLSYEELVSLFGEPDENKPFYGK